MASIGKLEVDVEVKSNPEKFWNSIRDSDKLFPKAFPELYKSIEVLEGDGKDVGSVRLVKFAEGIPLITMSKEKVDVVDEAKKTVGYSVVEGDILTFYKSFKAQLAVEPKDEGSLVKWSCEFEKAKDDAPDPEIIFKAFAVKTFQDLDAYLLKA
ncbi:MLP-like protein 423 [Chenopodium quinoa]|uniref:Bet v I/Major latex protein domain-containing protein n=1 Tax=Chenopodium quinoa TaxID=63459 RepID=A0A803LJ29_CHEQI|nr:MLP-like protein 423 [Chenopodium quinoa]